MATVLPQTLATDRESLLFAIKETTFGTGVKPTATSQILLASEVNPQQNRGFIEDAQRRNTLSRLSRIGGRFDPGAVSFTTYIKPEGNLGEKPECAVLLEALMGREEVNASTDVRYKLLRVTDTRPSLTLWIKQGHFVYMCWGSLLTQGRFPIQAGNNAESIAQAEFTIAFAELRWTGTDELLTAIDGTTTPVTTIPVKDASKFSVGSYIQFPGNDNAGAGFEVTAVDTTLDELTVTPGVDTLEAIDSLVTPWVPTGSEIGSTVHGRLGAATRGGVSLPFLTGEITLANAVKLLNEEKNGLDFADRFIHSTARDVTTTLDVYFDANAPKFFFENKTQVQADVTVPIGDAAGKRVQYLLKNVEIDAPSISGGEEKILQVSGPAFASATFDDEFEIVFD